MRTRLGYKTSSSVLKCVRIQCLSQLFAFIRAIVYNNTKHYVQDSTKILHKNCAVFNFGAHGGNQMDFFAKSERNLLLSLLCLIMTSQNVSPRTSVVHLFWWLPFQQIKQDRAAAKKHIKLSQGLLFPMAVYYQVRLSKSIL